MASRAGPRVEGTDGSDFQHRETVAARYQMCVGFKSAIRKLNTLHILIWLLMVAQVIVSQLSPASHDHPAAVPFQWTNLYLLSIIPTAFSFMALPRNNVNRLVASVISVGLFCVAPLLYGAMEMFPAVLWLHRQRFSYSFKLGFSKSIVMMVIAVLVHGWQIYYSKKLLDQWFTSTQERKTK